MERIGVLGGTFDPPHLGHLKVAQTAYLQLDLDAVLWAPAGQPPHKQPSAAGRAHEALSPALGTPSPPHHRLAMTLLAIADYPQFSLCRLDLDRPGPHYSADLLALLIQMYGDGTSFWFVVGEDSLRELAQWHEPRRILSVCRLAVHRRSGPPIDWAMLKRIVPDIETQVDWLDAPRIDLSSSEIRRRVKAGGSIRRLVPPTVDDYIRQHNLYRL